MNVGENIRSLRAQMKLTQGELAKQLNVTQGAVSQWEKGLTIPDINQLVFISRLFDVSLDTLILGVQSDCNFPKRNTPARIRISMGKVHLSCTELSNITGISEETLEHYCSGAYFPTYSDILKIASALDVSADFLLCRVDNPKRSPNVAIAEDALSDICLDRGLDEVLNSLLTDLSPHEIERTLSYISGLKANRTT